MRRIYGNWNVHLHHVRVANHSFPGFQDLFCIVEYWQDRLLSTEWSWAVRSTQWFLGQLSSSM